MVSQAPSALAGADTLADLEIMHVTHPRAGSRIAVLANYI
jgi:hypothetical protein